MRRMTMHNRIDIRPGFVDLQMKQNFTGAFPTSRELFAGVIDFADVVGLHVALGYHGRRAEQFLFIDPNGDVAIVRRGKALGVNPPANFTDLFLHLKFVDRHDQSPSFLFSHSVTARDRGCMPRKHQPVSSLDKTAPLLRLPR